jgi:hypothetical protein
VACGGATLTVLTRGEPSEAPVPNVYILPDQLLVECGPSEAILRAALRYGIPFTHESS